VCPVPSDLVNGMITYSDDERPIPIGTVATYECDDGFYRDGSETRTCILSVAMEGTGEFTPDAAVCQRE